MSTPYKPGGRLLGGALPRTVLAAAPLALLLAGFAGPLDPGAPVGGGAGSAGVVADTVKVFVVWGGSNVCGPGDESLSPEVPAGTAYEWYWRGTIPPAPLDDPFPCYSTDGQSGEKGSMWPAFAVAYNTPFQHPLFLGSVTPGGKRVMVVAGEDWHPTSGELYTDGTNTIANAMDRAQDLFPGHLVVFAGVLWNHGGDLETTAPPWTEYRGVLHDLLDAFEQDVVEAPGLGGRFYFINTVIPKTEQLGDPATNRLASYYLDLEADVCSRYAFCSMIQESVYIKEQQEACWNGGAQPDCGNWYKGESDGNTFHWGQTALNYLGEKAAAVVRDHAQGDPFPWEVSVEVPQPFEAADFDTRVRVYDAGGALVADAVVAPSIANPDWTADFDGDDPDADFQYDWSAHATAFLTFEFIRESEGEQSDVRRRYVYVPTATAYAAGETDFFRPMADAGPTDLRFEVLPDATVQARVGHDGPVYEDVFTGSYVIPYNHAYACPTGCSAAPPGFFLAPVDEVPDATPPLRFTFAREADVLIPASPTVLSWDVPGLELRFPNGRRLIVEGTLSATGVKLTKADGALGWAGVVYRRVSGSSTLPNVLSNSVVEQVRRPEAELTAMLYGAIKVANRAFTMDDASEIRDNTSNVLGLLATGAATVTVGEFSVIRNNDGGGIVATGGARVTVSGQSRVENNGVGGVAANAFNSTLTLEGATIANNTGPGVQALSNGQVLFANSDASLRTRVEGNFGGLDARGGGLIDAGRCGRNVTVAPCAGRTEHELFGNNPGTAYFDARSRDGGAVYAQGNDWNVGTYASLRLVRNGSSVLKVCPMLDATGCPADGRLMGSPVNGSGSNPLSGNGTPLGGGDQPLPEGMEDVLAIVDAAEQAHLAGDMEAFEIAVGAVILAIDTSATEDDRRAAFEAATRLFAWEQPPGPLAALSTLAGAPGESQPWAKRALGVGRASEGDYTAARAVADDLVAAYAGTEHAEYGYGLAVRMAVELEDEAGAVASLLALADAFPESEEVGPLAALVLGAFPDADLSALAGLRLPGATATTASGTAPVSSATATAAVLLDVGEPRPNPTPGSASVPFVLGAEAAVQAVLYDALGRRVAVLASGAYGAGRHALPLNGSVLPTGVYVVYVVATGATGSQTAVRRITLTR